MVRIAFSLFLLLFFSLNSIAEIKLAGIFADNMVLQRDTAVSVWGTAEPSERITVLFAGQSKSATADASGKWLLKLDPVPANKEPQALSVEGKNKIVFNDVLVGDVWICSGQSNMAFSLSAAINAQEEIKNSSNELIRSVNIGRSYSEYPMDSVLATKWKLCTPENAPGFTAAGYFFAREIVKHTGVPVGLISASWGGTKIEAWIPAEGFRGEPELKDIAAKLPAGPMPENLADTRMLPDRDKKNQDFQEPARIFNSMINPLIPFAIKGVLWYQGEANGGEGDSYFYKMKALISSWRTLWKQGDFPFYYVQLANFRNSKLENPAGGDVWTATREAQLKIMLNIPNTGMASAIDIGEAGDIHPKNKQDVGKRLAAWALAKNYDKKIVFSGPVLKSFKVEGNKIRISFDNIGGGLVTATKEGIEPIKETSGEKIKWLAISGSDKKWYWADAVIDGDTVLASCENVPEPVAVRYAFAMNPQGANLYNRDGFPAVPFRSDDWQLSKKNK